MLLADTCPVCGERSASGTRSSPRRASHQPLLTRCEGSGDGGQQCGADLSSAFAASLAEWPTLVAAQEFINRALGGGLCAVGGERVAALDYFRDLRSIAALLLRAAELPDLSPLPNVVADRFAEHVEHRDAIARSQLSRRADGRRVDRVLRSYSRTPASAALMAAVATTAVEIADSPTARDIGERLRPLLECARGQQRTRPQTVIRDLGLSSRLADTVGMTDRSPRRIAGALDEAVVSSREPLTDGMIPQLFWLSLYESEFESMLPRVDRDFGRRFCSMAMIRMLQPRPWKDAAAVLELPIRRAVALAYACSGRLRSSGQTATFVERLAAASRDVALGPKSTTPTDGKRSPVWLPFHRTFGTESAASRVARSASRSGASTPRPGFGVK